MKSALRSSLATVVMAASLLAAGAASAQGTWNLGATGNYPADTCGPRSDGTAQCTAQSSGASGINATMYAFSNTGSNGAFVQTALASYDPSGFGTISGSNESGYGGQHAFDNFTSNCASGVNTGCGGSIELMIINFSSAVRLTAVDFGYIYNDADFSVYRADTPPASAGGSLGALANATSTNVLGAGWSLVGSADMAASGTTVNNPNDGTTSVKEMTLSTLNALTPAGSGQTTNTNLYSSWWVISTYFGANTSALNAGNDAFKILSFAATGCVGTVGSNGVCTTTTGVPEPATLALVGLALAGVGAARRRRRPSSRAAVA